MLIIAAMTMSALAQERTFRLAVDDELVANGAAKYILPRFSMKTGIRIQIVTLAEDADATLAPITSLPPDAGVTAAFEAVAGGARYGLADRETAAAPLVQRFREWLTSDVGRRTVGKFALDGTPVYAAIEEEAQVEVAAAPTGDAARGEKIAIRRCGRCHVISDKNRFGGIDSTPSFPALRSLPRWRERFETFWARNPHPAYTQVEGLSDPFDPSLPPPIAVVRLTQAEFEAILAFVMLIEPKDLGAPLLVR